MFVIGFGLLNLLATVVMLGGTGEPIMITIPKIRQRMRLKRDSRTVNSIDAKSPFLPADQST